MRQTSFHLNFKKFYFKENTDCKLSIILYSLIFVELQFSILLVYPALIIMISIYCYLIVILVVMIIFYRHVIIFIKQIGISSGGQLSTESSLSSHGIIAANLHFIHFTCAECQPESVGRASYWLLVDQDIGLELLNILLLFRISL